jgi:hypothetical protein
LNRRGGIFFVFLRVMAGFIPAIHVFTELNKKDVDARDRPGHDRI